MDAFISASPLVTKLSIIFLAYCLRLAEHGRQPESHDGELQELHEEACGSWPGCIKTR